MSILFRADDVPPANRLDYWRHVVERAGLLVERPAAPPARGAELDAWLRVGEAGPVRVLQAGTPAGECQRTQKLIRRADPDHYEVSVLTRGHVVVQHDGQATLLRPGDLTILDPTRPVRLLHPEAEHVDVRLPRRLLPLRHAEVARLSGARIAGDHGIGALISSLTRQLPDYLDGSGTAEGGTRLGTALIDLLTVALATRLDRPDQVPAEARSRALLTHIFAFVERHLGDPELSPDTIACAHYISTRYLYKLFASQRQGVAGWIRQRRLERCHRDLLDPAQRTTAVSVIGARWGFRSAPQFSHVFRSAYGLPPNEYRLTHAAIATPPRPGQPIPPSPPEHPPTG